MSCSSYNHVITNKTLLDAISMFEREYMDSIGDERSANVLILSFALGGCGTEVSITASNVLLDTLVYEIKEFDIDISSFDELVANQQCVVGDEVDLPGDLSSTSLSYVGAYRRKCFLVAIYADKNVNVDKYINRGLLLNKELGWIQDHFSSLSHRFHYKHMSGILLD